MNKLLYLVGEPGVGKSTVMAALTNHLVGQFREDHVRYNKQRHRVPHIEWCKPGRVPNKVVATEIGYRREGHSGTDVLGLHMQPVIVKWLRAKKPPFLLAEGDRLMSSKFFEAVVGAGYDLYIIWLYAGEKTLVERRTDRGSKQNEQWLRGRRTKVKNIVEGWDDYVMPVNADRSLALVLEDILFELPTMDMKALVAPASYTNA